MADEKKYNLKELKVVEGFLDNLQELVAKLIDSVQFNHLMRQKEYEKQESLIFEEEKDQNSQQNLLQKDQAISESEDEEDHLENYFSDDDHVVSKKKVKINEDLQGTSDQPPNLEGENNKGMNNLEERKEFQLEKIVKKSIFTLFLFKYFRFKS